jgi:hypothetical protein
MCEHLGVDVVDQVRAVLLLDPNVTSVELVGSRSIGIETALSGWDIQIAAIDVDALMANLPSLTEQLRPLAAQWDRLSSRPVYMLILPGGKQLRGQTDLGDEECQKLRARPAQGGQQRPRLDGPVAHRGARSGVTGHRSLSDTPGNGRATASTGSRDHQVVGSYAVVTLLQAGGRDGKF